MEQQVSNFVQLLREICEEENIHLESFSGNWAHVLQKEGRTAHIVGHQFDLNTTGVSEICRDKALTSALLAAGGVPCAEHEFLELGKTVLSERMDEYLGKCRTLLDQNGKLVLKDNYGTGGNRVFLIGSAEEAEETLLKIQNFSYAAALSPFYEILEEYRVVCLFGEPLLLIRKERAYEIVDGRKVYLNWRHNLGQGATGVPLQDASLIRELSDLANRALRAVPAHFASVDIIACPDGNRVLEINSGVMLEHFSGQDEACRHLAKEVYRAAIRKMLA